MFGNMFNKYKKQKLERFKI